MLYFIHFLKLHAWHIACALSVSVNGHLYLISIKCYSYILFLKVRCFCEFMVPQKWKVGHFI